MFLDRSMPRELPKRYNAAKSKSDNEIETSTISGSERGGSEEVAAGGKAIERAIVILTGVRHEIQGHHLLDAEPHHLAFVILHSHVRLIHTFRLTEVVADQMTGDAGHLLLGGHAPTRVPDLGVHHVEDTKMTALRDRAVDIRQADLAPPHAGLMAGTENRGFEDVVMIEQDPIHPQIPLAHVRPDEVGKDDPPPYHPVARHHLQDLETTAEDGIGRLHRALAQQAGTKNLRADQENHLPMTVMTEGVAHALIIERDQDMIINGVAAPAPTPAAAQNGFLLLLPR